MIKNKIVTEKIDALIKELNDLDRLTMSDFIMFANTNHAAQWVSDYVCILTKLTEMKALFKSVYSKGTSEDFK